MKENWLNANEEYLLLQSFYGLYSVRVLLEELLCPAHQSCRCSNDIILNVENMSVDQYETDENSLNESQTALCESALYLVDTQLRRIEYISSHLGAG